MLSRFTLYASLLRKMHQIGFGGPIGFQGFGINPDARAILNPTNAWRELSSSTAAAQ
jgi:hypothetical protein